MRVGRTWAGAMIAAVAMTLAATRTPAQSRAPVARSSEREPATVPPTDYPVNYTVAESFPGDCRYQATVRGRVRLAPGRDDATAEARYEPNLRVSAELRCQGAGPVATQSVLRRPLRSPDELREVLEARAELVVRGVGRRCIYSPHLRGRAAP